MRRIVAVGIVGLAFVGSGGISRPDASSAPLHLEANPRGPLLGVVWKRGAADLVRVNPRSLRPIPGRRVRIGEDSPVWSFSPDRSKLVINDERVVEVSVRPWLRVLDARTLRTLKWIPLESRVSHLYWLAPGRVVAIDAGDESFDVVVVDTVARRIVARRTVPGWVNVNGLARAQRALVMLVSPPRQIGPVRLVVASSDGAVGSVALEKILAGTSYPEHDASGSSQGDRSGFIGRRRSPGLAVDPLAARAYVVDPAGLVAEVALQDLSLRYHDLAERRSLLGRLQDWLEPEAQAKGPLDGPARYARWLGGDMIAVSGEDEWASTDAQLEARSRAAGLTLIDTRNWKVRTLDERASRFVVGAGYLLATGWSSDPESGKEVGMGLTAYALDGTKRFELFAGETAWVSYVLGLRAYVAVDDRLRIVDLSSGAVAGTIAPRVPLLLLEDQG